MIKVPSVEVAIDFLPNNKAPVGAGSRVGHGRRRGATWERTWRSSSTGAETGDILEGDYGLHPQAGGEPGA